MPFDLSNEELKKYMQRCIDLALQFPEFMKRPYVGALVLTPDRRVIGEGYRQFVDGTCMTIHAERVAIDKAVGSVRGLYLFTTLEPCVKTKQSQIFHPCSELIVESGIETVVIGLVDKNPLVRGNGIDYLNNQGVNVVRFNDLSEIIKRDLMTNGYDY
ncbi:hypothetical protein GOV12_07085 [Candidatus Pacearchaeota archaeon]|nr:hypothetical protein [Candidatus Pacearchaeota archaeon]